MLIILPSGALTLAILHQTLIVLFIFFCSAMLFVNWDGLIPQQIRWRRRRRKALIDPTTTVNHGRLNLMYRPHKLAYSVRSSRLILLSSRFLERRLSKVLHRHRAFPFLTLYHKHVFSAAYLFSCGCFINSSLLLILALSHESAGLLGMLAQWSWLRRNGCAVPLKAER